MTPGLTGTLTEVRLAGSCWAPSLTVEIQDAPGGVPIGTVRGSQTSPFTFPWIPTSFNSVVFATPVPVQTGVPYAIVLRTSGGYCLLWPSPIADSYAGGNAYFLNPVGGGSTWRPMTHGGGHNDLPFQTLVEPPASPLPPAPPALPAPPAPVVKPVLRSASRSPGATTQSR